MVFGTINSLTCCPAAVPRVGVLQPEDFAHYADSFNAMEDENWTNYVPNADSWAWMESNIPFFECPDHEVEEMYYFRWWSYRKHIVQTTNGFVITEFLTPVKHAGAFNTISCAAGFHVAEGRWLWDPFYLDDYIHFWFRGDGGKPEPHFHKYSSWLPAAVYSRYLVNGDRGFVTNLLDDFVADYHAWEHERQLPDGLFWQFDVRDGMEESISGSRTNKNARPTINSYMYGNARAIAAIARLAGRAEVAAEFDDKAARLKALVDKMLWDPVADFYKVRLDNGRLSDAREELGFIPWYLGLAEAGHESAWAQFTDSAGFSAPYGLTTAERRHPKFRSHGCCHCEWDGAVWPFATSQTLTALANALDGGGPSPVTPVDYFDAFMIYVHSQHANGKPYIGEYLDETTGQWFNNPTGRSRYYNHSTFADLLITGVVGLRPRADNVVEIAPLLPQGTWSWFCLDGIPYRGHCLTVLWDDGGNHYGRGAGLTLMVDGNAIAHSEHLERLSAALP